MIFKMKYTQFLLFSLIGLVLFNNSAPAETTIFAAKELHLKDNLPNEAEFVRPFEDPLPALLATAKGEELVQLSNCRDYLSVRHQIMGSDNETDYHALVSQTAPCIVLALLKSSNIAKLSALPKEFIVYTKTAYYPATLWPAISDDERKDQKWSNGNLLSYTKKTALSKINNKTLGLESSGYGFHITLLARGDFNHDSWEDAAFVWESYSLHGSYADVRIVVLTRTNPNNNLIELSLDQLLPK